ncbi:MAG: hypothetical protein KatS3mg087_1797 [Patescibacteria group bacterium]|nr:MAG: hypothetical protein KatS3mg087_1797 [Patescibacteria group bacterium]
MTWSHTGVAWLRNHYSGIDAILSLLKSYNPIVLYDARYTSSATALDQSGNGHHATLVGTTPTSDSASVTGYAFVFDGINDYIALPSSFLSAFDPNEHTCLFLWQPDEVSTINRAVYWYNVPSPANFPFFRRNGAALQYQARTGGSGYAVTHTSVNVNWAFTTASVSVSNSRATSYYNSNKQTTIGALSLGSADIFEIGRQSGTNYGNMRIAFFAVYNYELNDTQTLSIYNALGL